MQDESIFRAHDDQKRAWRSEGGAAHGIAPKGEGAGLMHSGFIVEACGGVPMISEAEIDAFNVQATDDEKAHFTKLRLSLITPSPQ